MCVKSNRSDPRDCFRLIHAGATQVLDLDRTRRARDRDHRDRRVVHAVVDADVIRDGLPDVESLRPMARLGRIEWSELGVVRRTTRIPYEQWPGHYGDSDPDDAA